MNKGIVSDISCDVCRDLIPLVADGVASEDSEALVHAHVTHCPACQAYLDSGGIQLPAPEPDAARVLGRIQRKLLAQSALTVDSSLNTSNRLRNELAGQLDTNRLCRDLKGRSPYETTSPSTRKVTTGYSIRKILCSGLEWNFPPMIFPCPPYCIRASTAQTGNHPRSRWKKPLPIRWR